MREKKDAEYRRFEERHHELKAGDNRGSFIISHMGHRIHHLYLWHLSDKMGVLSNVLSKLSPIVAADSAKVASDTAQVQRPRNTKRSSAEDGKLQHLERQQKSHFQSVVGSALSYLAITEKENNLRKEKKLVTEMKLGMLDAKSEAHRAYYEELYDHHVGMVGQYQEELDEMKKEMKYKEQRAMAIDNEVSTPNHGINNNGNNTSGNSNGDD